MSSPVPSSAPSSPTCETCSLPATRYSLLLVSYFRSGWAFLIPYLAAYLLYAWQDWPVNPATAAERSVKYGARNWAPALLHVYWILHIVHLVLATLALRSWWLDSTGLPPPVSVSQHPPPHRLRGTHYSPLAILARFFPWICLALLFYIPGIYLEWPADTWEHIRRINEWQFLETPDAHSYSIKSAYFMPYSLVCLSSTPQMQLLLLEFYSTGACLLLSWQYFLLARTCGLSGPSSLLFVVAQAVLFGNNVFSFYRYYGVSSTIFAQLGAVALTRSTLEFVAQKTALYRARGTQSSGKSACSLDIVATRSTGASQYKPLHRSAWPMIRLLLASSLLLLLVAFQHLQGLGIVLLGIGAVASWRLIEWKPCAGWWLMAGVIAANILFLCVYPISPHVEGLRAEGWLSAWLGFDLLDLSSPAASRAVQILGATGAANIAAAVFLARRNNVISWLTLLPCAALLMPGVAVPLAERLVSMADHYVVLFHRMFLASPSLLAVIAAISNLRWRGLRLPRWRQAGEAMSEAHLLTGGLCIALALAVILPPSGPIYLRLWHSIHVVPDDLSLRLTLDHLAEARALSANLPRALVVPTHAAWAVEGAVLPRAVSGDPRAIGISPVATPQRQIARFADQVLSSSSRGLGQIAIGPDAAPISSTPQIKADTFHHRAEVLFDGTVRAHEHWTTHRNTRFEYVPENAHGEDVYVCQNPRGEPSWLFTKQLIPIVADATYEVSIMARQKDGAPTKTFLAVAWYDSAENLLDSVDEPPVGAGNPVGWHNGIYSYFGLDGIPASREWTTYHVTFGLAETRLIPAGARFFSVGALLNPESNTGVISQICNVRVSQVAARQLIVVPFSSRLGFTPRSQTGLLSGHWPPDQAALDQVGQPELVNLARRNYAASQRSMSPDASKRRPTE